jgi:hypothetical protein
LSNLAGPTRGVSIALIVLGVLTAVLGGRELGGLFERLIAMTGAGGLIALAAGAAKIRLTARRA